MASFTATQWVQILAAAAIPLGILVLAASRMARRRRINAKTFMRMMLLSVIPATIVLTVQGILTTWLSAGLIVVALVLAYVQGSGGD